MEPSYHSLGSLQDQLPQSFLSVGENKPFISLSHYDQVADASCQMRLPSTTTHPALRERQSQIHITLKVLGDKKHIVRCFTAFTAQDIYYNLILRNDQLSLNDQKLCMVLWPQRNFLHLLCNSHPIQTALYQTTKQRFHLALSTCDSKYMWLSWGR